MPVKVKVLLSLTIAALVCAAVAVAETNKLKGSVKNDSDGKVSMKIVVKDGAPVKAKDVKVSNLDYKCGTSGDTGERTFKFGQIPIQPVGDGTYSFSGTSPEGDDFYVITGNTKNGKKVKGTPSARVNASGTETCASQLAGDFTYVAK